MDSSIAIINYDNKTSPDHLKLVLIRYQLLF